MLSYLLFLAYDNTVIRKVSGLVLNEYLATSSPVSRHPETGEL